MFSIRTRLFVYYSDQISFLIEGEILIQWRDAILNLTAEFGALQKRINRNFTMNINLWRPRDL
jgi:hypothetical protein